MDRLKRTWTGCGLALAVLLSGGGCRNLRSEVPPGKRFSPDTQGTPPIGFSNAPHAATGMPGAGLGTPSGMPGPGGGSGQFGTPAPGAQTYGAPTDNAYGAPGSSPAGSAGLTAPSSVANPTTGIPQTGTGPAGPAAGLATPGQTIPGMP